MAADPSRRHSSAEALAHDLDAFLARPRRLAVLTGLLLLAAVLAAGLTFLPIWAHPPTGSNASGARETSLSPLPAVPLRVEALDVEVHRRIPEPAKTLGRIGIDVFEGRYQNDDVRVHARLSAPAYCYVIALNPDGKDQLFFPEDPSTPPPARAQIDAPADSFIGFGLTDGVGLQGVVLVALEAAPTGLRRVGQMACELALEVRSVDRRLAIRWRAIRQCARARGSARASAAVGRRSEVFRGNLSRFSRPAGRRRDGGRGVPGARSRKTQRSVILSW